MRKAFILLGLLVAGVACGQSVREVWTSMPDALLGTLDKNKRLELLDFFDMGVREPVENRLNGKTVLDTLTNGYMRVRMSDCSTVELRLFPCGNAASEAVADSAICLIQTFLAPQAESRVRLFSRNWTLLADTCFTSKSLLVRPDTMTEAAFRDLMGQIPVVFWKAEASVEEGSAGELLLTPSFPLAFVEQKEAFAPLVLQRKFNLKDILLK